MEILSVGNFLNPSWDGSIPDEEHIAKELEGFGHEVYRCQRDGTERYATADFTLIAQWDGYTEEFISTLPRPLIYWAFDYQADGQEWHEKLVKESDLYLSKRIADSKHPNWQWLSQDFAPKFLDKAPPKTKDIEVLFTGSYLPWATERNETLKAVNERFNLVIHSVNQWPKEWGLDVRPPVMDDGLPELYSRAKIILSIDHTLEAGYWSDRNAQIMCCGYRPIFRYVPLSEATFRDNVWYVYSIEQTLRAIQYKLEMAQEDIDGLDQQSYEFAKQYLTVNERVYDLITIVESIL